MTTQITRTGIASKKNLTITVAASVSRSSDDTRHIEEAIEEVYRVLTPDLPRWMLSLAIDAPRQVGKGDRRISIEVQGDFKPSVLSAIRAFVAYTTRGAWYSAEQLAGEAASLAEGEAELRAYLRQN